MNEKTAKFLRSKSVNSDGNIDRKMLKAMKKVWNETPHNKRNNIRKSL